MFKGKILSLVGLLFITTIMVGCGNKESDVSTESSQEEVAVSVEENTESLSEIEESLVDEAEAEDTEPGLSEEKTEENQSGQQLEMQENKTQNSQPQNPNQQQSASNAQQNSDQNNQQNNQDQSNNQQSENAQQSNTPAPQVLSKEEAYDMAYAEAQNVCNQMSAAGYSNSGINVQRVEYGDTNGASLFWETTFTKGEYTITTLNMSSHSYGISSIGLFRLYQNGNEIYEGGSIDNMVKTANSY